MYVCMKMYVHIHMYTYTPDQPRWHQPWPPPTPVPSRCGRCWQRSATECLGAVQSNTQWIWALFPHRRDTLPHLRYYFFLVGVVKKLQHLCHTYVSHGSSICAPWLIHKCAMTLIYVTWLKHMHLLHHVMYSHIYIHIYIYTYIYIYTLIHVYMFICINTYMYTLIYIYTYIYIYVKIHISI